MIHYHGMPFSGRDRTTAKCIQGKHACISYADTQPLALCAELCQSFMLDNGAFTTWRQGKKYDMSGYAEVVKKWHKHPSFDWYVIPDSIDGADAENNVMRAKWLNLVGSEIFGLGVPVWHLHETIETLNYLSLAYSRIAIGSSGECSEVGTQKWWARMAEAMEAVCDDGLPRCKIHGFRMLDPTVFSHFPFSSADSTNVARNIGIDSAWTGTYSPASKHTRAIVMMERIEAHASASRWAMTDGLTRNNDLFG